jgi:isocitrate lyase
VLNIELTSQITAVTTQLESEGASKATIDEYLNATKAEPNLSLAQRRELSSKYTKKPVFFSWDIPRTREGFYHFKAGMDAATKRAKAFAPYADLLWVETGDPSVEKAAIFAGDIRKAWPGKKLVYNLSPSFNWMAHGFTEEALKSFVWDLAKNG